MMESNDSIDVAIVKVFARKVWVESDIFGSYHVVVQHMDGTAGPFTYCSFFYDYGHTCNSAIRREAIAMALRIGAVEPVECRQRLIMADI